MLKNLVFIHGRPACGKDTQSDLITASFPNSYKISGVYRSAFTQVGDYAQYHDQVSPYIKPLGKGIDIPGHAVINILNDIVESKPSNNDTVFLICGLLRTIDHKNKLYELMGDRDDLKIKHVYLSSPESMSISHAQKRMTKDREEGEERTDDRIVLMQARLDRYKKNTIPMLKELQNEGRLKIIRADRPVDEVNIDIRKYLSTELSSCESEFHNIHERL